MATVDIDWSALDDGLANTLLELLNKHLSSASRPSFLGPVTVLGFEFGSDPPDVEVVDIQDIYPDFLEDDEGGETEDPVSEEGEFGAGSGVKHGHMGYPPQQQAPFSLNPDPLNHPELLPPAPPSPTPPAETTPSSHPDLQVHLHISHHSNLRVTLQTALLINYPSPSFMTLPLKLSIVGLIFNGEFVVAYEGSRRRVHLCIVDGQDPSCAPLLGRQYEPSHPPTPPDGSTKPLPIGQRLLPNIFIESEIGEADSHVLKNVSRVERFIQDVVRKVVTEELVYPNFQTIVLAPRHSSEQNQEQ